MSIVELQGFKVQKRIESTPPHNRNVLTPFFYFAFALGRAIKNAKSTEMCKFKQIYKNVPGIGFFFKAGGRFAKRMELHKFVDTNLLINLDPLKMGKCVCFKNANGWFKM